MTWENLADTTEETDLEALTLGDLRSGESVTVTIDAEPEQFESDQYGTGVRVEVTLEDSDYNFSDIDVGEQAMLVTWSSRLVSALVDYKTRNGGLVGDTVTVEKTGTGMDVEYSVTEA